ncbi:MAG: hypothetical protein ACRESF_01935 [Pseudomonas sp.]
MKLLVKQNATGVKATIFAQDSSSTVGAGLTGLVYNTSGLTAYYYRQDDASSTAITLATMTLGTWATGGLIVVDGTNMKGLYQLGLPSALFTALGSVTVYLQGATNLAPVVLEIQVVAFDPQDAVHLGLSSLPNTAVTTNASLLTSGTAADQLSVASGIAQAKVDKSGYALSSAGLDSVIVEAGLNARQSLSILASALAGVLAGAGTTTITIAALGVPATNRITATVDSSGNRTAVTLAVPV